MALKAQVGLELITSLIILLLVFSILILYSIEKVNESNDIKTLIDAKRIAESVADNLDGVQQQGEGYFKYFQIPMQVQGNFDYTLFIGKNMVEISWNDRAWAAQTIAYNVTINCLSYGLNETNRVWNRGGYVEVSCHRPNLMPVADSIEYWNNNGNVTIGVRIENDAHVGSGEFNISFASEIENVSGLGDYGEINVNHTIVNFPTGGYLVVINVDEDSSIEESIESDNSVNRTITI